MTAAIAAGRSAITPSRAARRRRRTDLSSTAACFSALPRCASSETRASSNRGALWGKSGSKASMPGVYEGAPSSTRQNTKPSESSGSPERRRHSMAPKSAARGRDRILCRGFSRQWAGRRMKRISQTEPTSALTRGGSASAWKIAYLRAPMSRAFARNTLAIGEIDAWTQIRGPIEFQAGVAERLIGDPAQGAECEFDAAAFQQPAALAGSHLSPLRRNTDRARRCAYGDQPAQAASTPMRCSTSDIPRSATLRAMSVRRTVAASRIPCRRSTW